MVFLQDLAHADALWGAVVTSDAVLIIAAIVEGRSARDEIEQTELRRGQRFEADWEKWERRWDKYQRAGGDEPGPTPPLVRPVGGPDQDNRAERVVAALIALSLFVVSMLVSLVLLSPVRGGDDAVLIGSLVAIGTFVAGLGLLLVVGIRRMLARLYVD